MMRMPFVVALCVVVLIAACAVQPPVYPEPAASTYTMGSARVGTDAGVVTVTSAQVTPEFFADVRVAPLIGRALAAADAGSTQPVVLLGYDLWQKNFHGAADMIGKTVPVDDKPTVVVGVMPRGLNVPKGAQVWLPGVKAPAK